MWSYSTAREMMQIVLKSYLDDDALLERLRQDPVLLRKFDELYQKLFPERVEARERNIRATIAVPDKQLDGNELLEFYTNWGFHLNVVRALAKIGIQPRTLLDTSLDQIKLYKVGEVLKEETRKAVKMIRIILGEDPVGHLRMPETDYCKDIRVVKEWERKWEIEKLTNRYLDRIGYPWSKSLHPVSSVLKEDFTAQGLLAISDAQIEKRDTWKFIAPRIRLLRMYLQTIQQAE